MDPSLVLEQTIQDVSNLDSEFHHILEEIRSIDNENSEIRKKYTQKETQLYKFIKQHGSIVVHPKEESINMEIKEGLEKCISQQNDKCNLANTALFLVSRHLNKLEKNISMLEEDGVLAPLENEIDSGSELSRENSVLSGTGEKRKRALSSNSTTNLGQLKRKKQQRGPRAERKQQLQQQQEMNKGLLSPLSDRSERESSQPHALSDDLFSGNNDGEEEDKKLYCFCQSVSYGEMVACDGPNCKYEWFHYTCVNLKEPPKGIWYCPDCRQEMAKSKLKKKKT